MLTLSRDQMVHAPAELVWAVLTDWPRHSHWVPLTTVSLLTPTGSGVGARFVGRTGLGPLAVDDVMEVVTWQPPGQDRPGRCEVVKQGALVRGRAVLEVLPRGSARTLAVWTYHDLAVAPVRLTRYAEPLLGPLTATGLSRVLAAMARDAEAEAQGGPGPRP